MEIENMEVRDEVDIVKESMQLAHQQGFQDVVCYFLTPKLMEFLQIHHFDTYEEFDEDGNPFYVISWA